MLSSRLETLEVAHRKLEQQLKSGFTDLRASLNEKVHQIRSQIDQMFSGLPSSLSLETNVPQAQLNENNEMERRM